MDNIRLEDLLSKYLHDNCTEDEQIELMDLLAILPETDLQRLMDGAWDNMGASVILPKKQTESLYRAIAEKGDIEKQKSIHTKTTPFPAIWFRWVALLLLVGLVAFLLSRRKLESTTVASVPFAQTDTVRTQIRLPDGSLVTLNQGSSLRLATGFGKDGREVYLQGEAYFMISKNPKRRFVVHTGNIRTEVLGTSFNINAYNPDGQVTVTVTEGRVRVLQHGTDRGILSKDEQLVLSRTKNAQPQILASHQTAEALAWQEKDLYFTDVSMEEAMRLLEQRFATKVVFANNALKRCRFSGTFPDAANLEPVLKVLCAFNHSQYKKEGDHWLVYGTGC